MSDSKIKKAKGDPEFIVYVLATCSVKIYSTDDSEEAAKRASEIVREALRTQDNNVMIPRVMVQPFGTSLEDVREAMRQTGVDPDSIS